MLLLMNCTVTDNHASSPGHNDGGGIFNFLGGQLTVINSTISGNTSFGGYGGGGILNLGSSTLIINSTIFENQAGGPAGFQGRGDAIADHFSRPGSIIVENSILASPTQGLDSDCYSGAGPFGTGPTGPFVNQTSLGHNIVSDTSGVLTFTDPSDLNGVDPLLGPLANNGGLTRTHLPLAVSPAINAGPLVNSPVATDQRGIARPDGAACDIGSVEVVLQCLPPTIIIQPQDLTLDPCIPTNIVAGPVTFTVAATGTALAYQWQSSPDGLVFTPIANAHSPSYSITAGPNAQHLWFRVRVFNSCGHEMSAAAEYSFVPATTPPALVSVQLDCANNMVCLYFNKAVIGSTRPNPGALDPLNYTVDGVNVFITATFGSSQSSVCLLIDPLTPLLPGPHTLDIGLVEDFCGNSVSLSDNFVSSCPICTVACGVQSVAPEDFSYLWPPDGRLIDVVLTITTTDCSPVAPEIRVYSNELNGDPPFSPDVTYNNKKLKLRAQRDPNNLNGRVYLIHVKAVDAAGNSTYCHTTVGVPRIDNPVQRLHSHNVGVILGNYFTATQDPEHWDWSTPAPFTRMFTFQTGPDEVTVPITFHQIF